jgi:hypothetical protein
VPRGNLLELDFEEIHVGFAEKLQVALRGGGAGLVIVAEVEEESGGGVVGVLWPASHPSIRSRLLAVAGVAKEVRIRPAAADILRNVRRFTYVEYRALAAGGAPAHSELHARRVTAPGGFSGNQASFRRVAGDLALTTSGDAVIFPY